MTTRKTFLCWWVSDSYTIERMTREEGEKGVQMTHGQAVVGAPLVAIIVVLLCINSLVTAAMAVAIMAAAVRYLPRMRPTRHTRMRHPLSAAA